MLKKIFAILLSVLAIFCVCKIILPKNVIDTKKTEIFFKPNFNLLGKIKVTDKEQPYVAIYRRGNKTLVYMADFHGEKKSWDMVDWCFSENFKIKPDVLITEFEHTGRRLTNSPTNTLEHAAFVAERHNIPVVLSDLSDDEKLAVLGDGANTEYLNKVSHSEPKFDGNDLEKAGAKLNRYGRNPFMLQNIATALNKYDTVFVIFGEGHLREQYDALKDMFGALPEYITEFPENTKTEYGKDKKDIFNNGTSKVMDKMQVIKLVDFNEMKGKENGEK